MLHSFTVPEYRLYSLRKKLDSINKKAQKLKIRGIEYKVSDPRDYTYTVHYDDIDYLKKTYTIKVVDIILDNLTFGLKGWSFLAVIEHREQGNTILKVNDDVKIPAKYRKTTRFLCEHCKSLRDRNNTYLVYNQKKGKIYQVGSTCIHNYLGFDATIMMNHATIIRDLTMINDRTDWDDDRGWGKRAVPVVGIEPFITTTQSMIEKIGFVSSKKARETGETATGHELWSFWMNIDNLKDYQKRLLKTTDAQVEKTKKIIDFVKSLEGKKLNEYEENILSVVKSGYVTARTATTVASMVPYYEMKNRPAPVRKDEKPSEYVGKEGERTTMTLTSTFSYTIGEFYVPYSKYPIPSVLENLIDKDGNKIVWFNKSGKKLEKGKTYTGKVTIKKHQEYKGIKQTVIARFAFEENKV